MRSKRAKRHFLKFGSLYSHSERIVHGMPDPPGEIIAADSKTHFGA